MFNRVTTKLNDINPATNKCQYDSICKKSY